MTSTSSSRETTLFFSFVLLILALFPQCRCAYFRKVHTRRSFACRHTITVRQQLHAAGLYAAVDDLNGRPDEKEEALLRRLLTRTTRFLHASAKQVFKQSEALPDTDSMILVEADPRANEFVTLGISRERLFLVDDEVSLDAMIETLDRELFQPMTMILPSIEKSGRVVPLQHRDSPSTVAGDHSSSAAEPTSTITRSADDDSDVSITYDSVTTKDKSTKKKGKKQKNAIPEIPPSYEASDTAGAGAGAGTAATSRRRLFSVVGIDCEWRPEGNYSAYSAYRKKAKNHFAVSELAAVASESATATAIAVEGRARQRTRKRKRRRRDKLFDILHKVRGFLAKRIFGTALEQQLEVDQEVAQADAVFRGQTGFSSFDEDTSGTNSKDGGSGRWTYNSSSTSITATRVTPPAISLTRANINTSTRSTKDMFLSSIFEGIRKRWRLLFGRMLLRLAAGDDVSEDVSSNTSDSSIAATTATSEVLIPPISNDSDSNNTSSSNRSSSSKSSKKKQQKSAAPSAPVILFQIGTRSSVFLLDLQSLCRQPPDGKAYELLGAELTPVEHKLDAFLSRLLHSEDIIKLGIGPTQDIKRLAWSYCWMPAFARVNAVLDLQTLAKRAHPDVGGRELDGLSKLTRRLLGRPVDKSQQCSDWSARPLEEQQLLYAGMDAWLLTQLFDALCLFIETGEPLLPPPPPPPLPVLPPVVEDIPVISVDGAVASGCAVSVGGDGYSVSVGGDGDGGALSQQQEQTPGVVTVPVQGYADQQSPVVDTIIDIEEDTVPTISVDTAVPTIPVDTAVPNIPVDTPALLAALSQKLSVGNSCLKLLRECVRDYIIEAPDPVENFLVEAAPVKTTRGRDTVQVPMNNVPLSMILPVRSMKMAETPMRKSWLPFLLTICYDADK